MTHELAARQEGNDALDIAQHIGQMLSLGQTLVKSGLLPSTIKSPEAAVAVILKGRELGVPPMQALSHIYIVSGKPTLSAELMMAMMLDAGHDVWIEHTDSQSCSIKGIRRGKKREQSLTFTMNDAKKAGVTNNPTWSKYPDAMLRARAISAFARMFAPDVLMGASYTPEELGAAVDEDGDILDVEVKAAPQSAYNASDSTVTTTVPEFEPNTRQQPTQAAGDEFPDESDLPDSLKESPDTITAKQLKLLAVKLKKAGFKDTQDGRDQARAYVMWLLERGQARNDTGLPDRTELASSKDLTKTEASYVLNIVADDDLLNESVAKWTDEIALAAEEAA